MERGSPPPDRPDPERAPGPESPPGPPAPSPGPQAPPPAPQGPQGYAPPAPGPESAPSYGDPVPPGGWQQPIARPQAGWAGQPLAGWGTRLAAMIIDGLILLIPIAILGFVIVGAAVGDDTGWVEFVASGILYALVVAAIVFLYAPTLMRRDGRYNGQTWGKQVLGIRVVRDSGEPVSFGWAALREVVVKQLLVGIASSIIPFIPWFLNYFWPLWDDQNRALHDMVVSSHVVKA
jgi:uncharacterized RDD family membrane protein YckC